MDFLTIIIILGIVYLIQFIVLSQQFLINKNYSGIGWWLLSAVSAIVAFSFLLLRSIPSLFTISVIMQNVAFFNGYMFIYIGIVRFFDKKENTPLITSVTLLAIAGISFFIIAYDNIQIRAAIIVLVLIFFSSLSVVALYRNRMKSITGSVNFLITIFILSICVLLYRFVAILFGHVIVPDSSELFNVIPYLLALGFGFLSTFGFILMINQRLISEIKEAKDQFELIFQTSPYIVLISRLDDGYIYHVNPAFSRFSGYSASESIGKTTTGLNLWVNLEDRKKIVSLLLRNKSVFEFETQFRKKDGNIIYCLMSANIVTLGGTSCLLSSVQDITSRKETEISLRNYAAQLKLANETKDKFFSIIAHDLRSPFHALLGFSAILAEDIDSLNKQSIKEMALQLNSAIELQYQLLEDLLNWARLQKEDFLLETASANLRELVTVVLEPLSLLAKQKGISLQNKVPPDIFLTADLNMIKLALRNLVSNSIKFTYEKGFVEISALKKNDSTEISVSDNGIGIPQKGIDGLLADNIPSSTKGTGHEKGTGLGLLLCREIVKKHNGRIWVESELGKGSKFIFNIPDS